MSININSVPKIPSLKTIKQKNPINSASLAFSNIVTAYNEYKVTHEIEETKRENIRAYRDITVEKYRKQRDFLEKYLTETFKERSTVIKGFFDALDSGLESGNDNVIKMAMSGIVSVIQKSPLQDINDFMKKLESDSDEIIEI